MKSSVALLVVMLTVGSILALAADPPGKPTIIKDSAETDVPTTPTKKPASDLVAVDLNAALLAKREAAMDAMEEALDAEVAKMLAEHKRRVKEQADWRAKERARVGK